MIRLRVKELAGIRGLNMSQLQILAGVSMGLIRRYWYNTADRVELRALAKLAKVLGVAPSELIGEGGDDDAIILVK